MKIFQIQEMKFKISNFLFHQSTHANGFSFKHSLEVRLRFFLPL